MKNKKRSKGFYKRDQKKIMKRTQKSKIIYND